MKKVLYTLAILLAGHSLQAQKAYIIPSPTDANEEVTLFIDISQSVDGEQNNALKAMLTDHPEDPVYLWSWMPAEPVVGNGAWDVSNPELELTKVADLLYSITFVPTEFYGVDGATFFANGISCLAKLENGNAYDGEYDGEAKTEDLMVEVIPKLCDRRICIFPEIREEDDFLTITYDNNQEEVVELQNLGNEECYLYLIAYTFNNGFFEYVPEAQVTSTPELRMKRLEGEPGKFRLTIVPSDFWTMLPEGASIDYLRFLVTTPGFSYQGPPPFETISIQSCD